LTPLQTFTLEGFVSEVRANVPRIGEWGLASSPPLGSQAVVAAIGGDRGNLVVLGVEDRDTRPTLLPGEVQIYTALGPVLRAVTAGTFQTVLISGDVLEVGTVAETSTAKLEANSVQIQSGTGTLSLLSLAGGNIGILSIGGNVTIQGTNVAINGNVTVTGTTIINGTNFDTHTHAVPAGTDSAGGVTGAPI
jgi:phage baseplate assembly protein V